MSIGKRIKELRLSKNYTMVQLAELINIKASNISRYEKDEYNPSSDVIIALSQIFEVSTDFILLGNKDNNNKNYNLEQLTEYEKQIIYKCRSGAKIIFDDDLTSETGLIDGLTKKESNIILKYRALDERNKEELEDILNLKYDRVLKRHVVNENKDTSSTLISGKENMVG